MCYERRNEALFRIIREHEPDFICLQEGRKYTGGSLVSATSRYPLLRLVAVLVPFIKQLIEVDFIRENYSVSDIVGRSIERYGVLLLSKHPAKK